PKSWTSRPSAKAARAITCAASWIPCPPIPVTSTSRSITTRVDLLRGSLLLHGSLAARRATRLAHALSRQPLDEQAALHLLGGGRARDGVDALAPARDLEAGEQTVAVAAHVLECRRSGLRRGDDDGAHHLTPLRVGQSDHRDVGDSGQLGEHRLDLGRCDGL